ncbi:MAG: HAD family phosphatase [Minisyncoccales bacterium]|jgi:epoxide hydrolase-like predicted phosphatase
MIKTIIFDYDGVVKKSQKLSLDIIDLYKISIEEYEKNFTRLKPIIEKFDKNLVTEEKFWIEFSEALGKVMPEKCGEKAKKMYKDKFVFFPEVIELIEKLKIEGFRLSILSNMFPYQAEIIKKINGCSLFDDLFFSCERGLKKPDLEFYELVAREMNVRPQECLFIDDKEENLLPAEKLGMKTVLAKNQEQIVKDVWAIIKAENKI